VSSDAGRRVSPIAAGLQCLGRDGGGMADGRWEPVFELSLVPGNLFLTLRVSSKILFVKFLLLLYKNHKIKANFIFFMKRS
jgi:hypothetical protein